MAVAAQGKAADAARRKRINRLKKIIIGIVIAAILVSVIMSVVCGFLVWKIAGLKEELRESEARCDALLLTIAEGDFHLDDEYFPEEIVEEEVEMPVPEEPASVDEIHTRKVYLTFDDGPSENTRAILDVLKEYNVKATFFVTGQQALSHPERYREIAQEGHTLAMHSYSHKYSEIYETVDSFGEDLLLLQTFLEETTGVTPMFYRFPGGSSNTVSNMPMSQLCDYLADNGITYFDWNITSKDAVSPMRPAEEIVTNCTQNLENFDNAVILLHDAANKTSTVEALPEVIEYILAMENTEILPITQETVVIHH